MLKDQKVEVVGQLKEVVEGSEFVAVIAHNGLSVAEITQLRRMLYEKQGRLRVFKNTLFARAVKDTNKAFLGEDLRGPQALVWGDDPVGVAKVLKDFVDEVPKIEVKIAALGERQLTPQDVERLADMPTLDEAKAMFLGLLQSVPGSFVRLLAAAPQNFVYLLMARRDKLEQA